MTKPTHTILLLILTLIVSSCKNELDTILEPDFNVVQIDYGFDNYMKNMRDKSESFIIKQRNLVLIDVDKNGLTSIEDIFVEDSLISSELIKYLTPSPENEKMPMTVEKEFQFAGKVTLNKNLLIMGRFSKELSYQKYREIRNKIYVSFNIVRNEFSLAKHNKSLSELISSDKDVDKIKWSEIKEIIPIRYSETVN